MTQDLVCPEGLLAPRHCAQCLSDITILYRTFSNAPGVSVSTPVLQKRKRGWFISPQVAPFRTSEAETGTQSDANGTPKVSEKLKGSTQVCYESKPRVRPASVTCVSLNMTMPCGPLKW